MTITQSRSRPPHHGILVATELGLMGADAVAVGDTLARDLCLPLVVAHVISEGDAITPLLPHLHESVPYVEREAAAGVAVRHHVKQHAARRSNDFDVVLEHGAPDEALTRLTREIEPKVLVIGASRKGTLEHALLGSTAEQILRHAPCPVLVARRSLEDGPIVLGTDLTDPDLTAEQLAAFYARTLGRPLILVHGLDVFRPLAAAFDPSTSVDARTTESLRAAAEALSQSCLERIGITARRTIDVGDPARLVIEEAERTGAALVVLSSHGREGMSRLAHGSTAEHVVRGAPCSVLVTHRGG
ncbi:MAG: universal stress protein [Deltaproteobacteria bacterium]|nr:universal stress protein [Deltaproteobacteria bacterium]